MSNPPGVLRLVETFLPKNRMRTFGQAVPLDRIIGEGDDLAMPTDDETEAELARLTDAEVTAIWMNAPDPEHPTRREELALGEMERRQIDF